MLNPDQCLIFTFSFQKKKKDNNNNWGYFDNFNTPPFGFKGKIGVLNERSAS
jgi:hypothetical protein